MKVLALFDFFDPSGGGTIDLLFKTSQGLAQRGHQVSIYTSDFKLNRDFIATLPEVKIQTFHCIFSVGLFYITPSLINAVRDNLKGFDVVHLNCLRSFQNIVIHHYAVKYKVPYIIDTHGSVPRKAAGEVGFKWIARWVFDILFGNRIVKDACAMISPNKFGAYEHEQFGAPADKTTIIPLPIPTESFKELPPHGRFRKEYNIKEQYVIMSLGRLNYIKGLEFLVESFYQLASKRKDVFLVMVGNDTGYKTKLDHLITKLGLDDRVLFPGFLSGQAKLSALVDADVVVQPSRYEQAAWAPVEAVLCGTPVIVSKDTGSAEDISKMDAGYLVSYGDKDSMVQVIQSILDNPGEAKAKVEHAKKFIAENLALNQIIGEYEILFQKCRDLN